MLAAWVAPLQGMILFNCHKLSFSFHLEKKSWQMESFILFPKKSGVFLQAFISLNQCLITVMGSSSVSFGKWEDSSIFFQTRVFFGQKQKKITVCLTTEKNSWLKIINLHSFDLKVLYVNLVLCLSVILLLIVINLRAKDGVRNAAVQREKKMLMRKSGPATRRALKCGWGEIYSSEMDLEDWRKKKKTGTVLSSHALRSMWSGIKAQQNGMKKLIPSTVRYRINERRGVSGNVKFI